MKTNIFIPKQITVGYQQRNDTYTKKLAYVIYTDNKGVLRKEKSWQSWRKEELGRDDFKNEAIEGFVLNKNVGGHKSGWDVRQAYCRVYDPRGFEFEITIPNLLYILENANSIKGKGLEGKFIYGWDGTDLVLIPEYAPEFQDMQDFTDIQGLNIGKKDLVEGWKYLTKENKVVTYLGHHLCGRPDYISGERLVLPAVEKEHWFYGGTIFSKKDYKFLSKKLEQDPDFANLMDKAEKHESFKTEGKVEFVPINSQDAKLKQRTIFADSPEGFCQVHIWNGDYQQGEVFKDKESFLSGKRRLRHWYNYSYPKNNPIFTKFYEFKLIKDGIETTY